MYPCRKRNFVPFISTVRLRLIISSMASSLVRMKRLLCVMPAQFTRTSMRDGCVGSEDGGLGNRGANSVVQNEVEGDGGVEMVPAT